MGREVGKVDGSTETPTGFMQHVLRNLATCAAPGKQVMREEGREEREEEMVEDEERGGGRGVKMAIVREWRGGGLGKRDIR
jgi:hypothetical protein